MDQNKVQAELKKINQAMAAQEALRGTLADEQIEATLAPLRQKQAELKAKLAQATGGGSGAVAQGSGSKAVGERGVMVEGDVGGSIIAGDGGQVGGIRAHRIEADNVVQGMQQIGGDLSSAADAVALAEALSRGTISADSIQAKNVVAGLQYIADPAQATPNELRQQVAELQRQLKDALADADVAASADVEDVQEALAKVETELAAEQPRGSRVVRKLKEAAEVLTEGAKTTDAAHAAGMALIKLAPVAAALYQIAVKLFGG